MRPSEAQKNLQRKGNRSVFKGCLVGLSLGGAPYETKRDVRKKITSEGGNISYIVTSKCAFLVNCNPADDVPYSTRKAAQKYKIPIVSLEFVDLCVSEGQLLPLKKFLEQQKDVTDERLKNGFKKGQILNDTDQQSEIGNSSYNFKMPKLWKFMDESGPRFYDYSYKLIKFVILKGQRKMNGEIPFCVLEIHVSEAPDDHISDLRPRYCVYSNTGSLNAKLSPNITAKLCQNCRFSISSFQTLETFGRLYKTYTSPPHMFSKWDRQEVIPPDIGSSEFQKFRETQITFRDQLDEGVIELVEHLWTEAIGRLQDVLAIDAGQDVVSFILKTFNSNKLDEAESILLEIRKILDTGRSETSESIQILSKQYYKIVLQQNQDDLSSKGEIFKQQELVQLLRDVVSASEATGNTNSTAMAKYSSLNCWITRLDENGAEFSAIKDKISESKSSLIEIHNVFALRRPVEDMLFDWTVVEHKLLFHSTAIENLVGILSRGLLHPRALPTDKTSGDGLLGFGIYFSDSFDKTIQYSQRSKYKGTRMSLLADVAVGRQYETTRFMPDLIEAPKGYDSVKGVSSPNNSAFRYDEFVVYRTNQQRIAYLIEFSMSGDKIIPIPKIQKDAKEEPQLRTSGSPLDFSFHSSAKPNTVALDRLLELVRNKDRTRLVSAGLQTTSNEPIQMASSHIRAKLLDLACQVVIVQEYVNHHTTNIEAKYVFPLDEMAAVCGFEAFINDKHVIGVVEERETAHKQYTEAIKKGHGAYLMDQEESEIFSVTVGNLPANSRVLIKIIYVAELKVENEKVLFAIPGSAAKIAQPSDGKHGVKVPFSGNISLEIGIDMPFEIRRLFSPTNNISIKKTDTLATVKLCEDEDISAGFELEITLSEIHVPRMWVEELEENDIDENQSESCMLTFYPSFESEFKENGIVIFLLDCSNSMKDAFVVLQATALLCLQYLNPEWKFNVLLFGSVWEELFPSPQTKNCENLDLASAFIKNAHPDFGCTELLPALNPFFLLPPDAGSVQNIFLISDGHISNAHSLLYQTKQNYTFTRIFTFGVGSYRSPCNHHLMKNLANQGAGCYELFDWKGKHKWEYKVKNQLQKASQPVLTDISVEWQQFETDSVTPVQAPSKLLSLFNGTRQVVYGFVPHCTVATLKAKVNGSEISAVVSTTELSKTKGKILHRLSARAIIQDWVDGILEEDNAKNETLKSSMKPYIIQLSKKYGVLTPLTSYIAIETRNQTSTSLSGPSLMSILRDENVDRLGYIPYPTQESAAQDLQDVLLQDKPLVKEINLRDRSGRKSVRRADFDPDLMDIRGMTSIQRPDSPSPKKVMPSAFSQPGRLSMSRLKTTPRRRMLSPDSDDELHPHLHHATSERFEIVEASSRKLSGELCSISPEQLEENLNRFRPLAMHHQQYQNATVDALADTSSVRDLDSHQLASDSDHEMANDSDSVLGCGLYFDHSDFITDVDQQEESYCKRSAVGSYGSQSRGRPVMVKCSKKKSSYSASSVDVAFEHIEIEDVIEESEPLKLGKAIRKSRRRFRSVNREESNQTEKSGDAIVNSAQIILDPNLKLFNGLTKLQQILRTGPGRRESDLNQFQSRFFAEKDEIEVLRLRVDEAFKSFSPQNENDLKKLRSIWGYQLKNGSFDLSDLHKWNDSFSPRVLITNILDNAGIKSMGTDAREDILDMCATIIAVVVTMNAQIRISEITFSIIKAIFFITWVRNRFPLAFNNLELHNKAYAPNWESFVIQCLNQVLKTPLLGLHESRSYWN